MKRIMAGMTTLLATAVILSGIAFAQTGSLPVGPFWFEFSGGLNLRDQPTSLGIVGQTSGYVVGNSYNFDYYPDGTARKRSGVTKDTIALAAYGNMVNYLGWLTIDPSDGTTGPTLAHAGNKWYHRVNDGTAPEASWTEITAQSTLAAYDSAYIGSTLYGSELFVASESFPLSRYDGTSLYRVPIEDIPGGARADVELLDGGSLDTTKTYSYAHTYVTKFYNHIGEYQEGPLSAPVNATPRYDVSDGVGYYSVTYKNIPLSPTSIGTAIDTSQIVAINIYRSDNGGGDWYYLTTISSPTTSYSDDGSKPVDMTRTAPYQQIYPYHPSDIEEHGDFLFMQSRMGTSDTLWSATARLHGEVEVSGGYQYTITVWGDADGSMYTDTLDTKLVDDYLFGTPSQEIRFRNADVNSSGSITVTDWSAITAYIKGLASPSWTAQLSPLSDYAIPPGSIITDGTNSRTIRAVVSDTTFIIEGESLAQNTTKDYYIIGPSLARSGLFYVGSRGNVPIIENWDEPYQPSVRQSNVSRIISMPSSLYMFGQRGIWELVGYDAADFYMPRVLANYGIVGRGAVDSYLGGALFLDYSGLYYISSAYSPTKLTDILDNAVIDSVASGRIDASLVREYNGNIYVVTPYDGKQTDVWYYDTSRRVWTRYKGWHIGSLGEWTLRDGYPLRLFYGDRRIGNVYYFDESRTADVSITGADSAITAEIYTPRFNFGTDDAVWNELHLVMDTNDSVRVSFEIGAYDSTFTISPDADGISGPTPIARADSSMTSGVPKTYILPIRATGHTCRVHIWTQGTGRCTIYPSRILASRKEL